MYREYDDLEKRPLTHRHFYPISLNTMLHPNRRDFLKRCFDTSCGFSATLLLAPVLSRRAYGQEVFGDVIGKRSFARIEKMADGVWALISTPFNNRGQAGSLKTHSNGGLIVGKDKILAIDSYRTAEGASYMAEACQFLTGRLPDYVVNTHFHFDHLGGTRGFMDGTKSPEVIMTQTTRKLAFQTYTKTVKTEQGLEQSTLNQWGGNLTDASKIITDETKPFQLDLGNRIVTITPMSGHTGSDLVITDNQSQTTFGGDLIWDGIFPNFMSSSPVAWRKAVQTILKNKDHTIVPGHGGIQKSDSPTMQKYQILLEEIEKHARASHQKGISSDAAAKAFQLPQSVGNYEYFRAGFHEIAMDAWYRELKPKDASGK